MKVNMYYRSVLRRASDANQSLLTAFLKISSWPRMLLEVFIRKNFGERYFSFSTGILIIFVLALFPLATESGYYFFSRNPYYHQLSSGFWSRNLLWYLYLVLFFIQCLVRKKEIERLPSVFDFARYSLSSGLVHPFILNFKWNGKPLDIRTIETLVEPGLFFVLGLLLSLFGQTLGILLIICSIIYWLGYEAAYNLGDQFVMDKIDEMICNEELANSFIEGKNASETRGVQYYGRKPADPDARRKLAETFLEEEVIEVR